MALAFERPNVGSVISFATMVTKGVAYVRRLMRNTTSGAKVPPATLRIVKALQAAGAPGDFQRRCLKRRASGTTADAAPTQSSMQSLLEMLDDVPSPVEVLL